MKRRRLRRPYFIRKRSRSIITKRSRLRAHDNEEYPHDMLYHPSPAMKSLEKMIEEDDYNPSRRQQRKIKEIMDDVDFDNENDT